MEEAAAVAKVEKDKLAKEDAEAAVKAKQEAEAHERDNNRPAPQARPATSYETRDTTDGQPRPSRLTDPVDRRV